MATPHIALFPCSGTGILIPFLRLAATIAARGCTVTVITLHPTVSASESEQISTFFALHPHIKRLEFQPLPFKKSNFSNKDPFFMQVEAISNSVHLLDPFLAALSPPLSAIISDLSVVSSICRFASNKSISIYVLVTTSARFFSLVVLLPKLALHKSVGIQENGHLELPGLGLVPVSSIAPPLYDSNHFLSALLDSNIPCLSRVKAIFVNSFAELESETIKALNSGRLIADLAPVLALGPFQSFEVEKTPNLPWLDEQAPESVLFVSFGSRTALPRNQILELRNGLEKSGYKFLWVLKTNKVDKDDKEEVQQVLGESFLERTKKRGMVIKGWVKQDQILAHPAIGGFISHCGWNSVTEAARLGVPILAWPQNGDQKLNAEVIEKAGIGLWADWGWLGEVLVSGDDIAKKISEMMVDTKFRVRAKEVKEKVRQAREIGGDLDVLLRGLMDEFSVGAKTRCGSNPKNLEDDRKFERI
ncbi:UDP-glycosyltransferase 708G1-like [Primulina tabacum]|uniref:UDP-glycosyltransferase 708G1-like n=1 Tax=Primulina tabacum TaxID=48773 RepID=UPI003F5AD33A